MGRKKKKSSKPWCWYCNREFEDEKILLQHQKAKHFKCHICHKKLFTGPGLQIHCMQVHKENIERVPNSIKGRDNITIEICGMDNIPEEDLIEHEKQKSSHTNTQRDDESDSDSDASPKQNFAQKPAPPKPTGMQGPLPHLPPSMPPPMPGMPPVNPMMHQMMMMYPHMAQMMAMNPMMMNQMMGMPPGMMPPQMPPQPPALAAQQPPPPPPPPAQQPPQPLMSLMGMGAKPTGNLPYIPEASSSPQNGSAMKPKPLFPSAADYSHETLNEPSYVSKIDTAPAGSRIVHPEEDISLEEYRASFHKYKYITPQYSAPAVPNPSLRPPNAYAPLHGYNGNGY